MKNFSGFCKLPTVLTLPSYHFCHRLGFDMKSINVSVDKQHVAIAIGSPFVMPSCDRRQVILQQAAWIGLCINLEKHKLMHCNFFIKSLLLIEVNECFYGIYKEYCFSFGRIIRWPHRKYSLSNSTFLAKAEIIFASKKPQSFINAIDDNLSKKGRKISPTPLSLTLVF